jgi:transposase InsO family protein
MNTYMNDQQLTQLGHLQRFTEGATLIHFSATSTPESYTWISQVLTRFSYHGLRKKDKREIVAYVQKMTGYSRQQLTRLVAQHRKAGKIKIKTYVRHRFAGRYTREDIVLLAKTDELHQTLSGPATKKLCERAFELFKQAEYERLATISVAHLYNLRKRYLYRQHRLCFTKTQRTIIPIGERTKPRPEGAPGYLRVDTVHQGDENGKKGVYHINLTDEVTQWEIVCSVEKISEMYLIPVLEIALKAFPFVIIGFHSDNGSEYINKTVAELLHKMLIRFTKSRARHTNDNALAECKNGAIVRKVLGYGHIPQHFAPHINAFNLMYLNPYLNYHRPCFFAEIKIDGKGKRCKTYPYKKVMTPYEKLKSLLDVEKKYLREGVTLAKLEAIATAMTDNEAAKRLQTARRELFDTIFERNKSPIS